MIVPESFNATGFKGAHWNTEVSSGVQFTAARDPTLFNGVSSERLTYVSGTGSAGVSNRGLGNVGMVLEVNKDYEGLIFASNPTSKTVPLVASLEDYVTKQVLATQTLNVSPGGGFHRYNFSLTPSASTRCVDVDPAAEPGISCGQLPSGVAGHACVKCAGQFKLSMASPGSVLVNYAFLQPGQWGRLPGLSVLKSAADLLKSMGIKAIRQGGSFASSGSEGSRYCKRAFSI